MPSQVYLVRSSGYSRQAAPWALARATDRQPMPQARQVDSAVRWLNACLLELPDTCRTVEQYMDVQAIVRRVPSLDGAAERLASGI